MKVNEIFYSLQGEGQFTGTAAVFLRLSGCNLKCPFCDTRHEAGTEMTDDEIIGEIGQYPSGHLVITGGEPSMQLGYEFVEKLRNCGYFVQVETNGVLRLPPNVDWITCSPKYRPVVYDEVDELKCLFHGNEADRQLETFRENIRAKYYCLQPCDMGNEALNAAITRACINYIKEHPQWHLSLQTHKILDIR